MNIDHDRSLLATNHEDLPENNSTPYILNEILSSISLTQPKIAELFARKLDLIKEENFDKFDFDNQFEGTLVRTQK